MKFKSAGVSGCRFIQYRWCLQCRFSDWHA